MKNNVSQAKRLLLACQRQVCCAGKVCNTWPLSMRVIMRSMRQGSQGTFSSSSTGWTRGWFQHSYEISNSQGQAALFFSGSTTSLVYDCSWSLNSNAASGSSTAVTSSLFMLAGQNWFSRYLGNSIDRRLHPITLSSFVPTVRYN